MSSVEDLMINRRGKRSKSYIPESSVNVQRLLKKISSNNSVRTTRTHDSEELNMANRIERKISENASLDLHGEQEINRTSPVEKKSAKLPNCVSVNRIKKTISNSEMIRDNDSNQSLTFHEKVNETLSSHHHQLEFMLANSREIKYQLIQKLVR